MRERRIQLDLDEQGDVVAWSVTIFNASGETAYIQVKPFCPPEEGDAHEVLGDLAGFQPDLQQELPLAFSTWPKVSAPAADGTPMSARSDPLR